MRDRSHQLYKSVGTYPSTMSSWRTTLSTTTRSTNILAILLLSLFISPKFTPFSAIGPSGLLRFDQLLIPILIIFIVAKQAPRLKISYSLPSIIVCMTALCVFTSLVLSALHSSNLIRISDLFDVIIWVVYSVFLLLVAKEQNWTTTNLQVHTIIFGAYFVCFLGILQMTGVWSEVELFSDVLYGPGKFDSSGRLDGVFKNPNEFAQFLLLPFFFTLIYALKKLGDVINDPSLLNLSICGIPILIFANIYFTYSRTALLASLVGIGVISVRQITSVETKDALMRLFGILTLGAFLLAFLWAGGFLYRYQSLLSPLQDSSLQTRLHLWQEVLPLIRDSPVFGYGPSKASLFEFGIPVIDSGIIGWLYHYGTLGLFVVVLFYLGVLRLSLSLSKKDKLHQDYVAIWSLSSGVFVYTLIVPILAITMPVVRYRRSFTLYLVVTAILISCSVTLNRDTK